MRVAILQARMSSTRLPGKVMADIRGRPMIANQLDRIARAKSLHSVLVATSTDPSDDVLSDFCARAGIAHVRGPLHDVLARYALALDSVPLCDTVVRLTADCPLIDPDLIDDTVAFHTAADVDYAANRFDPAGLDVEVAKVAALRQAARDATDLYDREYVVPFLYRNPERFSVGFAPRDQDRRAWRWTVDLPSDLAMVRAVFDALAPQGDAFGWRDIAAWLHANPHVAALNGALGP
jgi:spore coat polysaccharide biosynthesis protein SpsF